MTQFVDRNKSNSLKKVKEDYKVLTGIGKSFYSGVYAWERESLVFVHKAHTQGVNHTYIR